MRRHIKKPYCGLATVVYATPPRCEFSGIAMNFDPLCLSVMGLTMSALQRVAPASSKLPALGGTSVTLPHIGSGVNRLYCIPCAISSRSMWKESGAAARRA